MMGESMETVGPDALTAQAEALVRLLIGKALGRSAEDVDPCADFADLGLDSAAGAMVVETLEAILQARIELEAVYDHPTVTGFVEHLGRAGALQRLSIAEVAA